MSEHDQLNELLESGDADADVRALRIPHADYPIEKAANPSSPPQNLDICQWQVGPNDTFRPASKTIDRLPAGAYKTCVDQLGPFFEKQPLLSDDIIDLPDSANLKVLNSIRRFWASESRYKAHGLVFKRGVLLWGPPGSGKSTTVYLLTRDLIAADGIVIYTTNPGLALYLVGALRKIEPDRPLIVVLEDIDEIIQGNGEYEILSMLDGENQTANVVYIATTNHPERLGARIVNRPSRFDERIFVGMPSLAARLAYLHKATSNGVNLDVETVDKWAKDTDGLSIAHLRELVAAILCLDQEYGDVLERLKSMTIRPKEVEGFTTRRIGV